MGQKYGQHFLTDISVLDHIEAVIDDFSPEHVIEIGPGRGALTQRLLGKPYSLLLSEIDTSLQTYLTQLTQGTITQIIWGDILQQPVVRTPESYTLAGQSFPPKKTLVVGNLPYYITSPILRMFFGDAPQFLGGVFLVQYEVADKIRSDATKKSYLRRLLNIFCEVRFLFPVPASSFSPPPKVVSAVISLIPREGPMIDLALVPKLLRFLDLANPFKRKTLGKIQKMQQNSFTESDIFIPDALASKRLEELGREEVKIILGAEKNH